MKNQIQKLVRGVIYDDPNIAEASIDNSANLLSALVDRRNSINEDSSNEEYANNEIFALLSVACVANPVVGGDKDIEACGRNFIIPEKMVDHKLRRELERLDISEAIVSRFIEIRNINGEDTYDQDDDNIRIEAINKNGEVITVSRFENSYDAVKWIMNRLDTGAMSEDQAVKLLQDLSRMDGDNNGIEF